MNRIYLGTTSAIPHPHLIDTDRLKKPALYLVGATVLILFGDILLPFIGHLLLLGLEVIEALLDQAIEHVFGVDPWTSQLITAWTGFFAFLAILVYTGRWLRSRYLRLKAQCVNWLALHSSISR